ncbi:hypothetical protein [Actinomycetospora lemnae]|uniref:Uncharacterized protein n=1 Tax=Actinomycetospora lemnae TaxID=3019891 RepID=A0ABT5SSR8_9PSEU|nr:hypothetical protein [Actinomycetospora sp. DW7H6]MDD7965895.1 hypothetical protein [Actinomycetospora sp. DW7H6]
MAMETLTPIAKSATIEDAGTQPELLARWNIDVTSLDPEIRRRVLFQGNDQAYREAKKASDGFEHGYLDFETIKQYSATHHTAVAHYVRNAIIQFSGLADPLASRLLSPRFSRPLPSIPMAKYVRGVLHGDVSKLAQEDMAYPYVRVETIVKSASYSDATVDVTPEFRVTPVVGEGITARDLNFEVWGPDTATYEPPGQGIGEVEAPKA